MRRLTAFLASTALIVAGPALAGGYVPPIVSVDLVAGQRLGTPNATVQNFSPNTADDSAISSPGPYYWSGVRKVHFGHLFGASSYYRCKLVNANFMQGPGENVSTTGNITSGSNSVTTIGSLTKVIKGDSVSGTGIPSGTTVLSVSTGGAKTITMSQNATATTTGVALTFSSLPSSDTNWSTELAGMGGPLTITNSIIPWASVGSYQPQTFKSQGSAIQTVASGNVQDTDWLYGAFTPDTDYAIYTTVYWQAGGYVFGTHSSRTDLGENYTRGTASAPINGTSLDLALQVNPSFGQAINSYEYAPSNIVCSAYVPNGVIEPSFAIIGDSIGQQAQDVLLRAGSSSTDTYGDSAGNAGPYERLLANAGYSYVNVSQSSKRLEDFTGHSERVMQTISGGATFGILQLGINSAANSASLGTMEAQFIQAVAQVKAAGMKPIAVTIGTETTTTDGGATLANQTPTTPFAVSGVAQQYNDWLRATGAPTYTNGRLLDFADAEMGAGVANAGGSGVTGVRDSQKFRVDIAPFADWYGYAMGETVTAGSGQTAGTYTWTATGGGCTTEPQGQVVIGGGGTETSASITNKGVGCTSAPLAAISGTGGTASTITLFVHNLGTGIHPLSLTDVTGAATDGNGTIATYLASQLAAAVAIP